MPNFFMRISQQQDDEITELMTIEGYTCRAEFMRFVIKYYKYHAAKNQTPEQIKDAYKRGEKTEMLKAIRACGDDYDG